MVASSKAALVASVLVCVAACATMRGAAPGFRAQPVTWLVFVDELHVDFRNTGRVKTLLRTIVARLMHNHDSLGLLSGNGPSQLTETITTNRAFLEQQIDEVAGAGLRPSEMSKAAVELRYRMHIALSSAYEAIERSSRRDGQRTAIVYVSNGYLFASSIDDIARPTVPHPFSVRGNRFSVEHVRSEMAALIAAARRAHVRIFAIDPRTMPGGVLKDDGVTAAAFSDYLTITRSSLRLLSGRTRGFAVVTEELPTALEKIDHSARQ
jgi:hypothetical protein